MRHLISLGFYGLARAPDVITICFMPASAVVPLDFLMIFSRKFVLAFLAMGA